jgi:hypothetical protein
MLLTFQLLFTFRNPGAEAIGFFRILHFVFLCTFIGICVILSAVEIGDDSSDADRPLSLWSGVVEFVCALFLVLPARALIHAITFPAVQKEDRACVGFGKVAIGLYAIVYFGRAIWNVTHYCGINALQTIVYQKPWHSSGVRVFEFFFIFVFDVFPSSLAILTVSLLRKHDYLFNETVRYSAALRTTLISGI